MGSWHYLLRAGVYANGLAIGFVLMGFEMLGSRYLNPYFGSGIVTWAALISTVLLALMVGYFLGGWLVDKTPHLRVLSALVIVASLYLFVVPGGFDNRKADRDGGRRLDRRHLCLDRAHFRAGDPARHLLALWREAPAAHDDA